LKVAAVSDDEVNISHHFGRAPIFVVLKVDEGKIVGRETCSKTGHHTFAALMVRQPAVRAVAARNWSGSSPPYM
jgi:predicted Fe-Mo cluster-binding NifX family protein